MPPVQNYCVKKSTIPRQIEDTKKTSPPIQDYLYRKSTITRPIEENTPCSELFMWKAIIALPSFLFVWKFNLFKAIISERPLL